MFRLTLGEVTDKRTHVVGLLLAVLADFHHISQVTAYHAKQTDAQVDLNKYM